MLGRKPFGFFEGEAAVIQRMKALREKGFGFDRIAAELNREGVPTRTRKMWHGVVVNRILTGRRRKANGNGNGNNGNGNVHAAAAFISNGESLD